MVYSVRICGTPEVRQSWVQRTASGTLMAGAGMRVALWLFHDILTFNGQTASFNTGLATGDCKDYSGAALSAAGREPGSRESALVQ